MDVKDLLTPQLHINKTNSEEPEPLGYFIEELKNCLSFNSREVKSRITQAKKALLDGNDRDSACLNYKMEIIDIIKWNPDADEALNVVSLLNALKEYWKWDYEKANTYMLLNEDDEELKEIAKGFLSYANQFIHLYIKTATEYLRTRKKIPDYKTIFKICFCNYMKRYTENYYLKKMNFNDEMCQESFEEIQEQIKEKGIELEASDNIKESFIKLCREKYLLAKKNSDFLFTNKKFKKEFFEKLIKTLDKELETHYNDVVKSSMKDIKEMLNLETEEDIRRNFAYNIPINVIRRMNEMQDDWLWTEWITALYFWTIAEVFEKEHNDRVKRATEKNGPKSKNSILQTETIWMAPPAIVSWKNILSEEENNLIREAVSYLDTKWQEESIVKYITKLIIKDLPIKFHDFKTLYNIKEIPPQTETILLDLLGLEYEIESEVQKLKEEEKINEEETKVQKMQEEIVIDDPEQYFINKTNELWYIIDNESSFRKQLQEFLQNENYATVLKTHLKNPSFLKIFLHKGWHSAARVIRIGMTGRRLLFEKKRDGKIHLICLANHNNYEDRLARIKNRRKG